MSKFIDLTGQKFGRLTVIERTEKRPRAWWKCQCQCGGITVGSNLDLMRGDKLSCGCLKSQLISELGKKRRKHVNGWQPSPERRVWKSMKSRCNCASHNAYKYYGGAGIFVCDEWQGIGGFNRFFADMGKRPSDKHSIDRIDNSGPYSKENCRWTTKDVQQRNTTATNKITINGRTLCAKDWAAEYGIKYTTVCGRLGRHWNPVDAVSVPADKRFRHPKG